MELEALNDALQGFTKAGATFITVTPQEKRYSRAMIEEKGLGFDMLSDPGNRVAKRYGIVYQVPDDLKQVYLQFGLRVHEYNGDESWELPMPARLIVDRSGTIRYAAINPDYTIRPDPQETLAALAEL